MRKLALLALLSGCVVQSTHAPNTISAVPPVIAQPSTQTVVQPPSAPVPAAPKRASDAPAAIVAEEVPAIPNELHEGLLQYQNVRSAQLTGISPSGSILVLTRFGATQQLHSVPFAGGRREQLTFAEEPIAGAFYLPHTDEIFYTLGKGGNENFQIYRLDSKTGRGTLMTDGTSKNDVNIVSESGNKLFYRSNLRNGRDMDLYQMNPRTGASEFIMEAGGEEWSVADITQDESRVLLRKYVSANEDSLYLMDLASKKKTEIPVAGGGKASHGPVRFSADGKGLYLASNGGREFAQLAYVDLATMSYKWLSEDIKWDVRGISITKRTSSKGVVYFSTNEDGLTKVYKLQNGKREAISLPEGVISGPSFSEDESTLFFTISTTNAPSDVYSYVPAKKKLERWTYSEVGGLDTSRFVSPELHRTKSFDGLEIPFYVYRPKNMSKKAPVIVQIHGGPEAQFFPLFSGVTQYWVNELGFAVVFPNVRGSTGYGKTYLALDDVEKREDSVKDIGAILDWVGTQPDLDSSKIGVYGGSYGGYMVLASLATFGSRIKAGVDVVGIANFTTFLQNTSPYRVDLRRVEYGDERKPEIKAFFEKISPANQVEKIVSSLMVVHGKNDPRVPFSEAEQIVQKVRAKGQKVWTVFADNEGHGFSRKENRDYLTEASTLFFIENFK